MILKSTLNTPEAIQAKNNPNYVNTLEIEKHSGKCDILTISLVNKPPS